MVKKLPVMQETWVPSLGREDPWKRKWQPTPALLPGESHGQRSLEGCSPKGRKESDTTEQLILSIEKRDQRGGSLCHENTQQEAGRVHDGR